MAVEPIDREDLRALQAGDDRALDRIIGRWERPLFAFAWRYLHNEADAREAAVEAFVRLYQQRRALRPDSNLAGWLFTTVANLCRNQQRWRRRHPTVSLDAPGEGGTAPLRDATADSAPGPSSELLHRETLEALERAIEELPHDLKSAVLLHHYQHLSCREIGAITGCRERGVETRLYRARQLLRDILEPHRPAPTRS